MSNIGPFIVPIVVSLGFLLLARLAGWVFDQDERYQEASRSA
jgi:hypothetical protein